MGWVHWLRAAVALPADESSAGHGAPERLHTGIELTGVGFRYPGTDTDVLRDVTIRIPAGATVAIVGDNGAGKSTLVKLLSRFYRPTDGRITVDGVDLQQIDPRAWRERIAAGFQDFVRLDATAHDSIGVGDLPRADDPGAVQAAVHRADAQVVVDRLPDGLDTHLGKAYEDGEELSGGQWQRIALSRAMMRDQPLLLLLDEPTAALDPLTEHALFERYAASARDVGRRTGGITVLVSHRFSTVRMADLILVVSDGRIAESGDHRTLMAQNGIYAELFTLQAAAYR
jgi:ATP-binding cassette subfamily B protein